MQSCGLQIYSPDKSFVVLFPSPAEQEAWRIDLLQLTGQEQEHGEQEPRRAEAEAEAEGHGCGCGHSSRRTARTDSAAAAGVEEHGPEAALGGSGSAGGSAPPGSRTATASTTAPVGPPTP